MNARAEILEALTDHPDGMTSKEIAPLCPGAECDLMVVGRLIAMLRTENKVHAAPETREGATVWIFGKEPVEQREAHVTLAGADVRATSHVSEAARAIANMRGGSGAEKQRPRTAVAAGDADVAIMHSSARETMRERVLRCLKEHGSQQSREMRAHGVFGANLSHLLSVMVEEKLLVRLGGGPRTSIFGLPGQTAAKVTPPEKGREPVALNRDRNGGGGTVTPAAGPADPEIHADLERHGAEALARRAANGGADNLYKAALLDLEERRAAKVGELAKLDRAIDAMRALT